MDTAVIAASSSEAVATASPSVISRYTAHTTTRSMSTASARPAAARAAIRGRPHRPSPDHSRHPPFSDLPDPSERQSAKLARSAPQ
ncbi:hypothetical protein STANM309S_00848 [Streptomyces tanashiensis]